LIIAIGGRHPVLAIVITMLVILLIAGCVVVYVAYPHRGEEIPGAPWLGDAMTRAADAIPVIDDDADDDDEVTSRYRMLG
jgi:hypothetical protein